MKESMRAAVKDWRGTLKIWGLMTFGTVLVALGVYCFKFPNHFSTGGVSGLGVVLGLLSRAKVHQCIAWIKEFPTGVSLPAFGDGTLVRDVDKALIETLDTTGRYLFS